MGHAATAPNHRDALKSLARAGYAARGVVYLLVGGLAAVAAVGQGGQTTGSRGALQTLLSAPWGETMLGAIAVGLVGYALWRMVQAGKDTDHHGTGAKGIVVRGGLFVSAVTHTLLAVFAVSLIFTVGNTNGGDGGSDGLAQWLMSQPYGRYLVGIVGVVLVGAGVAHVMKAWKMQFDKHFIMPPSTKQWAYPICRFGLAVRGLVFVIVGGFFLVAAYQVDPTRAGGMAEMFNTVRNQAFGVLLLAVVAIGLFAFGVYSLLEAVYRRVNLN